jgi:formamidopyrimidine-DNA glycosylase
VPELPEVETVRRGLARSLVDRRITRVEVGRERVVRRTSAEELVHGLEGCRVLDARRRGKYLLCGLDSGEELMIHLRMSGQVFVEPAGRPRPPHTHVAALLDDGHELWFVDPRTFGEVVVFDPAVVAVAVPELARLGIDPVADGLDLRGLRTILRARHRQLKALLLDQHLIAGIGNIYGDEILHAARLRPDRPSDTLTPAAERRLHEAIGTVLTAAIEAGGSTLRDAQYVDVDGRAGAFQDQHRVYGRTGERCSTCGIGWIRRIVVSQRSTHFCPRCQR